MLPVYLTPTVTRVWRQNLTVATAFWAACLVLGSVEATIGAYFVVGTIFFLAVPTLVALLTWVNRDFVLSRRPRRLHNVLVLGVGVLCGSTLIIFVGLLAAANLKTLLAGL